MSGQISMDLPWNFEGCMRDTRVPVTAVNLNRMSRSLHICQAYQKGLEIECPELVLWLRGAIQVFREALFLANWHPDPLVTLHLHNAWPYTPTGSPPRKV